MTADGTGGSRGGAGEPTDTPTDTVTVRLFANLREAMGDDRVAVAASPGDAAVDVLERLGDEEPAVRDAVFDGVGALRAHVNVTVDGEDADPDEPIGDASEIAVFPPVTGGSIDPIVARCRRVRRRRAPRRPARAPSSRPRR